MVDYRDGWPDPLQLFIAIRANRFPEFSQITALVILARCQDSQELSGVQLSLGISTVYPITAKILRRAQRILESIPLPTTLTADEAIVAATVLNHKLPLYTLDPARFAPVPGLNALRPY